MEWKVEGGRKEHEWNWERRACMGRVGQGTVQGPDTAHHSSFTTHHHSPLTIHHSPLTIHPFTSAVRAMSNAATKRTERERKAEQRLSDLLFVLACFETHAPILGQALIGVVCLAQLS
jgi:hypothetical protein